MISFLADAEGVAAPVRAVGERLVFGRSFLEPFASKVIHCSYADARGAKAFWIGEAECPFTDLDEPPSASSVREHTLREGVLIVIRGAGSSQTIHLSRTSAGCTPLYVALGDRGFVASWRFEEAVAALPTLVPHGEACRLYLEHNVTLTREQIFKGLYMVWPGETVDVKDGSMSFTQAPPPLVCLEGTIDDHARVTEYFLETIAASMKPLLGGSTRALIEISGGYDSTCVALAARMLGTDASSYGLIHDGAVGRQQKRRRSELNALLGFGDLEHPSFLCGPLAGLSRLEARVTPADDNHRMSCANAIDAHGDGPFDVVLTGVGGDELVMNGSFQRESWELPGDICPSAMVTAAARSDMFMRRGIWPKNPLMDRRVVDFCRSLPDVMRRVRMLNILTLARSGLSDGFIFPRYVEHYGPAMQSEASHFDYDAAIGESILVDHGVKDITPLLIEARNGHYNGFPFELIGRLFNLVKLETVLRHYMA